MVAIALISIAAGTIYWNMEKAVAKKHFQTEMEKLKERFSITQKLAITMQADWKGTLKKVGKGWVFESICEETQTKKFAPLRIDALSLSFDGKTIDHLTIDFFASGKISPEGTFSCSYRQEKEQWKISDFFSVESMTKQ